MRYSRMRENASAENDTRRSSRTGTFLLVCIIIGAAVYIISATKAADYISEKILTPVITYFAKDDEKTETIESTDNTAVQTSSTAGTVSFPSAVHYLLQAGVYSSEENAVKAASELSSMGAAGYIRQENEQYRVIMSGYSSKNDAENVKERLFTERGIETKLLEISTEDAVYDVMCSSEDIAVLSAAAEILHDIPDNILSLSLSLDTGAVDSQGAAAEFSAITNKIGTIREQLNSLADKSQEDAFLKSINVCVDHITDAADLSVETADQVSFSSSLKRCYCACVYAYHDFLSEHRSD